MEQKAFYEVKDMFGKSEIIFPKGKQKKGNTLFEYDAFVDKFKDKKTTDDCYTPKPVFDVVLNYLKSKGKIKDGQTIIRPFFPNNDYTAIEYPKGSIVVDNPPFSIFTPIVRFYLDKKIPFFLFAPHLTLLGVKDLRANYIVTGATIKYENGAIVQTSFVSNLFGDKQIFSDLELRNNLDELNKKNNKLPKYKYPDELMTVSDFSYLLNKGVEFSLKKGECFFVSKLDDQKKYKKSIFGKGVLMSQAQAQAQAKAKAKAKAELDNIIEFVLSERELKAIEKLG